MTENKDLIQARLKNSTLQNELIAITQYGAQLYGIATPNSDIDFKGVYLPSKEQLLLGKIPKSIDFSSGDDDSKNSPNDVDYEIYSLHYFIHLACNCQTVTLDMLYAPSDMIIKSSDIWEEIVTLRNKFHSKQLKQSVDYARSQASKYSMRGAKINTIVEVLNILKEENPEEKMNRVWEILPVNKYSYHMQPDPNGICQFQICGKIFQESAKIGYVESILMKYYNEYGKRAKLAADNQNIDWKAVSHALRIAYQAKEILTENKISFPLKNADFLLKVKQGNLNYLKNVAPIFDELIDEVESLVKTSTLPERVDRKFWDKFICEKLEETICV